MEHKEIKMVVAALIAGGLLYFGMQHNCNQNHDTVKIQTVEESQPANREEKMKQALIDIEEKMKNAPAQRQEKLQQIEEKIKARLEKIQERKTEEQA